MTSHIPAGSPPLGRADCLCDIIHDLMWRSLPQLQCGDFPIYPLRCLKTGDRRRDSSPENPVFYATAGSLCPRNEIILRQPLRCCGAHHTVKITQWPLPRNRTGYSVRVRIEQRTVTRTPVVHFFTESFCSLKVCAAASLCAYLKQTTGFRISMRQRKRRRYSK